MKKIMLAALLFSSASYASAVVTATDTLDMAGFDIINASTVTASSITATGLRLTISTNIHITGNVGIGTANPGASTCYIKAKLNSDAWIAYLEEDEFLISRASRS